MKILYVIHDNKKGGAAISFLEMVQKIQKEHEVFVITPYKNGFLPDKMDELGIPHKSAHYYWWMIACPPNAFLRRLKILIYLLLGIVTRLEAMRISMLYKNMGFDIIHSNSSVINFGGFLSKYMSIPHIWHIREYGIEDFNLFPIYSMKKIYTFMDRYSKKVIVISNALKEKYKYLIESNKLVQIYNGISNDMNYEKKYFPKKGDSIKFLIAGNYFREKGQIDVAYAALNLIEQGEKNFEVLMAGNGDFKDVVELMENTELKNHVKILGKVGDMVSLRRNTDIEIVASKCEALGRVTIEAMKSSNPVIGTNRGGTPELVKEGVTGFLYPYADNHVLSEKMKEFIENPEKIEHMGRAAYLAMKDEFTPEDNVNKVLSEYRKVIEIC